MENQEQSTLATRRVNARPAYKAQKTFWKLAAIVLFVAWAFTSAALVYTLRSIDIIKVVQPTSFMVR